MAANRVTGPKPPAVNRPSRPVIRPMYGVFIRDHLAKFRNEIRATIDDTNKAIKEGHPRQKAVFGDGVLQGTEVTKAKAAVKDLEKALKALKPVFPGLGAAPKTTASETARNMGRPAGPIAMYGVVFRDDLSRFRTQISNVIADIKAGMNTLKPAEKAEAKKALTSLQAALKDLGSAAGNWN